MTPERIFIGVLRLSLVIPGAHTLKDRRQVVRSLQDRMRHRFGLQVQEVGGLDTPERQVLACVTVGNDQRLLSAILDRARAFAESAGDLHVAQVDAEVFRWHPRDQAWGADPDAAPPETEDDSDG